MKRILFFIAIVLLPWVLNAQKDTTFYRHELKASVGDAFMTSFLLNDGISYVNISFSYHYRPLKWLWVGGNLISYFGNKQTYTWREYYPNGLFRDFSKSKPKYCAVIAPEIRFSYLNRKSIILYSSLSAGIGLEDGYDSRTEKYPMIFPYIHITYIGISGNFGKNKNIFLGGEVGAGFKGFINIHGGYRF